MFRKPFAIAAIVVAFSAVSARADTVTSNAGTSSANANEVSSSSLLDKNLLLVFHDLLFER